MKHTKMDSLEFDNIIVKISRDSALRHLDNRTFYIILTLISNSCGNLIIREINDNGVQLRNLFI